MAAHETVPLAQQSRCSAHEGDGLLAGTPDYPLDTTQRTTRVVSHFVLPDVHHGPPESLERSVRLSVASAVATDLREPEGGVRLRHSTVLRTAMPKTPVNKDGDPDPSERDIRTPGKATAAHVVAQAGSMECPPQEKLRRSAQTPHARHETAPLRRGREAVRPSARHETYFNF